MPNYNLVVDSTFQPFSLERYLQPLAIYGRAYNDAADTLDALSVDAGPLQNQINKDIDPDLYNQYNTYMEGLNALVDGMAKNDKPLGSILSDARKLRREYYKSIVPIKEGLKKLEEFNKEKRNLQSRDNSLRFSDVTLTDIVNNPSSSYSMLSGNEIMDSTVKAVSNLAKRVQEEPEYSKILSGQYWQSRIQQGYTPEQIVLASINDPQAPTELRNLKNSIHASYANNAAYDRDWVDQYINRGLYSAIGSTQYGTMANQGYISPAESRRLALAEREADRRNTPLPLEPMEVTIKGKDGKDETKTVSHYIDPTTGLDFTVREGGDPMRIQDRVYNTTYKKNPNASSSSSSSSRSGGGSGATSVTIPLLSSPVIKNVGALKDSVTAEGKTIKIIDSSTREKYGKEAQPISEKEFLELKDQNKLEDVEYMNLGPTEMAKANALIKGAPPEYYTFYYMTTTDGWGKKIRKLIAHPEKVVTVRQETEEGNEF